MGDTSNPAEKGLGAFRDEMADRRHLEIKDSTSFSSCKRQVRRRLVPLP